MSGISTVHGVYREHQTSHLRKQSCLPTLTSLPSQVPHFHSLPSHRFCTKPTVTRGKKVDTVIQGPQLNITVSAGNCSVAMDIGERQKTLACVGPSISYSKVQGGA